MREKPVACLHLSLAARFTDAGERVRVMLRCRPLSSGETADGRTAVVRVDEAKRQVVLSAARAGDAQARDFNFDAVFGPSATQSQVSAT